MIFDFPQFFGEDKDTKAWAGLLVQSLKSAFDRIVSASRDNIEYAFDDSTVLTSMYAEIVAVDLKSSGALVKLEFGSNSSDVIDLKLVRNTVDSKEILLSTGSSVWVDTQHEEGVVTYSLEMKSTAGGGVDTADFSDAFTRANEVLSANANWEQLPSGYAAKTLTIVSNEVTQAGTGSQSGTNPVYGIPTATHNFSTEYWCASTVVSLPDSGNTHLGLALECENVSGIANEAIFAVPRNDGSIDLQSVGGGSYGTTAASVITAGDTLALHTNASGDITVYVNAVSVLTESATGTPSLQPGYAGTGETLSGASAVFDDFEAGDGAYLTAGSATCTDTYLIATELKGI